MEIESLLQGGIKNINAVDDIFEIIKRKINLKVLESNCCDENYKQLCHTKNALQLQIDLYKCNFNEKSVTRQEQEESLIRLCCKYLELFFAILNFERIRPIKIETENIVKMIPAQPKVLDIKLIAGEEKECEIKADLEIIPLKITEDIKVGIRNKGNEIQFYRRNKSRVSKESSYFSKRHSIETENVERNYNVILLRCPMCETELKPDGDQCSMCKEPVANMMNRSWKVIGKSNKIQNSHDSCNSTRAGAEGCCSDFRNSNQRNLSSENGAQLNSAAKVYPEELSLPLDESNQKEDITKNIMMDGGDIDEVQNKLETSKNLEIYETLLKDKEKWICTRCTCLNTFDKNHCEVCDRSIEEVGSWICSICSFVNTKPFDYCLVCWEVNQHFKVNLHENNLKTDQVNNEKNSPKKFDNMRHQKDKENHFKKESWKCWHKFCEKLNSEKDLFFCRHCKLARNPPQCEGDLVLRFSKNGMFFSEVWVCGNCSYFNDKEEIKCKGKKCGQFRFYHRTKPENEGQMKNEEKKEEVWSCDKFSYDNIINDKKCKMCNLEKFDVLSMPNHWRCWNKNCKQFNKDQFDFCEYCKLTKHFSYEQGDIVMYKDKTGVKGIWVCRKCYKFNVINDYKCKSKGCNIDRFDKPEQV